MAQPRKTTVDTEPTPTLVTFVISSTYASSFVPSPFADRSYPALPSSQRFERPTLDCSSQEPPEPAAIDAQPFAGVCVPSCCVERAMARCYPYFRFALAFRRAAQYRFIRLDTSALAAADIFRARFDALATAVLTRRRVLGSPSSGKARSMAMISARSC